MTRVTYTEEGVLRREAGALGIAAFAVLVGWMIFRITYPGVFVIMLGVVSIVAWIQSKRAGS